MLNFATFQQYYEAYLPYLVNNLTKPHNNLSNQIHSVIYIQYHFQDDKAIRDRVVMSLSLLFGAKVMNISVPFFFKYAVDEVNKGMAVANGGELILGMETVPQAVGTTVFSLLVGCKYLVSLLYILCKSSFKL